MTIRSRDWVDWIEVVGKMVVIIGVIIGALFAVWEFYENKAVQRQQVAIEVVTHVKTQEILEALVRLEEHYRLNQLDYPAVNLDIAQVMSWYDHLGLLYLTDRLADECVIKGAVTPYAEMIQRILNELNYPQERRKNFDLLINRIHVMVCNPSSG